jgi:catechol 2,3-dioxygenase-like lactoylglutathione lyase family enzyme
MSAVLRTPDLARAVNDYRAVLGFECLHHIPGVFALLHHGPLQVTLWACAAPPGRFERPRHSDCPVEHFHPQDHSVVTSHCHALHVSLRNALRRVGVPVHERLPEAVPQRQPWGAWEFTLIDGDGHRLHCVDWGLWRPDPSRLTAPGSASDAFDGDPGTAP